MLIERKTLGLRTTWLLGEESPGMPAVLERAVEDLALDRPMREIQKGGRVWEGNDGVWAFADVR